MKVIECYYFDKCRGLVIQDYTVCHMKKYLCSKCGDQLRKEMMSMGVAYYRFNNNLNKGQVFI